MVKRCIYCNIEVDHNSVVDMCNSCMYKIWGPNMAQAIVNNMEAEKEKGNMELGRVSESGPVRVHKRIESLDED